MGSTRADAPMMSRVPSTFRRPQAEAAPGRRIASMLDHLCEEPKLTELSDCVHGPPSFPSDRSIDGNDAFQRRIYARIRCEFSILLAACTSTEFRRLHR